MAHALFEVDEDVQMQRIMVLSGMGGSGKTQMVAKFVREFAHRYVSRWMNDWF